MRFKINEIGPEGLPVHGDVTAEWLAAACPDLEFRPASGKLTYRGRISKSGDDYLFRAELRGDVETACARCLEIARISIDSTMTIAFVPADAGPDVEDDDPDVVRFSGGELDVSDELRDEILLAVPVKPLCADDCRGLCSVCGGNRNAVACTCEAQRAARDGRLGALARLKL